MSINDPYTALKYILQSNTAITDLLGVYDGTTIPLIAGGTLPTKEMAKSALVYYLNSDSPHNTINNTVFTINCYAQDTSDSIKDADYKSYVLAREVVRQTNEKQEISGLYAVTMQSEIISTIPDPAIKEVNKAVEIQLFNIGGA